MGTTKLQKLKITVYALFDAQRVWYMSFNEVLLKAGTEKVSLTTQSFSSIGMVPYKDGFSAILITSSGEAQTILKRLKFRK